MNNKLNVLIVDDHKMFLDGVTRILKDEAEINVAGSFTDSLEAMRYLDDHEIDVLITDLEMQELDGAKLCQHAKETSPKTKIMVVSMHDDIHHVTALLRQGVSGYITKKTGKEELLEAIKSITKGGTYYGESIKDTLVKSVSGHLDDDKNYVGIRLTKREVEIIQLIALEYSSIEIAERLFISLNTTETHRKNIMRKTNSKNMAGLIRYALKTGLIE